MLVSLHAVVDFDRVDCVSDELLFLGTFDALAEGGG